MCARTIPPSAVRLTPERPAGYSSSLPMTSSNRPRCAATVTPGRSRPKPKRGALRTSGRSPVERLRAICLALPEATEKVAWGEQEAMVFTDPVHFFRPPYVGPRGWVGVRIDRELDWTIVAKLVGQAYRLVAPPRLRDALETGAAAPRSVRRWATTRRS